ncbi:MAG: formyltetrahydrofolate deformylase [Solirubrobacterales bacterium]|nr:formyltetrahydrofolate deformylase [Solirubrobacterales bacterium]
MGGERDTAPSAPGRAEPGEAVPGGRLLISCRDRPGIVAAVSSFLHESGANIVRSDQHSTDPAGGHFFMRMEFTVAPGFEERGLARAFQDQVASRFEMRWRVHRAGERKRVAILVSRHDHCLLDLLWRWRSGELDMDLGLVCSNHPDLERDVRSFGLPFAHVPMTAETRAGAEAKLLERLAGGFDLIVLARYMQILSGRFLDAVGAPLINIHHSFLPAFAGADPHRRARERGVKIIGATAHYVTEEVDAGPIIEQDVVRVSHAHDGRDLERLGRDIERAVLARAVGWHVEDRVLVHENRTVVFSD